jgi:hypothetical protein
MPHKEMTAEDRRKLYASRKEYSTTLKVLAYERLGRVCCECGTAENVKIRFRNPRDPQKSKLSRHPAILASRILRDSSIAARVGLYCRPCRTRLRFSSLLEASTITLNHPSESKQGERVEG